MTKSCGRESFALLDAERDMEKIVFLFWVFSADEISSPQDLGLRNIAVAKEIVLGFMC